MYLSAPPSDAYLGSILSKAFHKLAPVLAAGTMFIPGVGPGIAAGITALDQTTKTQRATNVTAVPAQPAPGIAPPPDVPFAAPAAPVQPDYAWLAQMMAQQSAPVSPAPVIISAPAAPSPQASQMPPWLLPAGVALAALFILKRA